MISLITVIEGWNVISLMENIITNKFDEDISDIAEAGFSWKKWYTGHAEVNCYLNVLQQQSYLKYHSLTIILLTKRIAGL